MILNVMAFFTPLLRIVNSILEEGSVGSHATIVARALAIPLIIKADRIRREAQNGDLIILDANNEQLQSIIRARMVDPSLLLSESTSRAINETCFTVYAASYSLFRSIV